MGQYYFTPGPTQLHPHVSTLIETALHEEIPSLSHRSKRFEELHFQTCTALRKLCDVPDDYAIFFVSSGTEAMERIIQNCVETHSFHLVNGAFAERFLSIAIDLKKQAQHHRAPPGKGFDFSSLNIAPECELICITHNETSTGVAVPVSNIHDLKKNFGSKLLAVDIVSSAPLVKLDFSLIDCAFFSVQKCFGLPSGLGVLIVSEAALAKASFLQKKDIVIGSYHSFPSLQKAARTYHTPETPNVLAIYLLGKMCETFISQGLDTVRAQVLSRALEMYGFFDRHQSYKPFVKELADRSSTVLTVEVPESANKLRAKLAQQGIQVGEGYGEFKDRHIRIANFPAHLNIDPNLLLKHFA